MSEISAKAVMELRKATGCGLMECKKALASAQGDVALAQKEMRASGVLKAEKKSTRLASEGLVDIKTADDGLSAVMVEVNCETDFVARDDHFQDFVTQVSTAALQGQLTDLSDLSGYVTTSGESIDALRQALVLKIGENIQVRRLAQLQAPAGGLVAHYVHGGRLGVMVALDVNEPELGRDLAMHIAASQPVAIDESDCSKDVLDSERAVYEAQAEASGKPSEIQARIVAGRIKKYLEENTLLAQAFVKNPDITVGSLLKPSGATVLAFECFVLGSQSDA